LGQRPFNKKIWVMKNYFPKFVATSGFIVFR
jgi:hypothetical protein